MLKCFIILLETLNTTEKVDILLGEFNLNALDLQVFFTWFLSNLQILFQNCNHLNGSCIGQVFMGKTFLQTNVVNNIVIRTYFSDENAVWIFFEYL